MGPTKPGLLVILEARPGKESAVAEFLKSGLAIAAAEAGVASWYAFRITPTSFGIYDTFVDRAARHAHLSGPLANALQQISDDCLAREPEIRDLNVIAVKSS